MSKTEKRLGTIPYLKVGDTVVQREHVGKPGNMRGTVLSVREGRYSGNSTQMARVRWSSGSESICANQQLRVVGETISGEDKWKTRN
jgi:hypothetical protein